MWENGELLIDGFRVFWNAKIYDLPSEFGINGGRISKLFLDTDEGGTILEYDRGWNIDKNETVRLSVLAIKAMRILIRKFDKEC